MLPIASITKTFTAAEVLHLAESGTVDLDAPLSRYVRLPVPDLGATVRDALGMRSGIPDYVSSALLRRLMRTPDRHVPIAEMLGRVPQDVAQPNVIFDYSNTNYLLLGQLVEQLTGHSFSEAVHTDLVVPAGLARVAVQDAERPTNPLGRASKSSSPYLPNRAIASGTWSAGGMAADAGSLARWGYLLYEAQILRPATVQEMLPSLGSSGYGLGTFGDHLSYHGLPLAGHFGDLPGVSSELMVQREAGLSIAVLATARNIPVDQVMDDLATAVLES
jgi:D-alanyl-D-alanine carboxypeptidase